MPDKNGILGLPAGGFNPAAQQSPVAHKAEMRALENETMRDAFQEAVAGYLNSEAGAELLRGLVEAILAEALSERAAEKSEEKILPGGANGFA
jgi:hypothetical protein